MSSIINIAIESLILGTILIAGINLIVDATTHGTSALIKIIQVITPIIIGIVAVVIILKSAGYTSKEG